MNRYRMLLAWLVNGGAHGSTSRLDCGSTALCGVLALETGLGPGRYEHSTPSVHGLWPATGAYGTSACRAPSRSDANPTSPFSCYETGDSHQIQFEEHEWQKHGRCAGVKDATDFFSQVCELSHAPLAVMSTSRMAGRTLVSDFASDLAGRGFPVYSNDSRHGQITLTSCADSVGVWHMAPIASFGSVCELAPGAGRV